MPLVRIATLQERIRVNCVLKMLLTNHCKHALLHIIPQINWELKTLVCIDWLHKDIDCDYFGALLQRTLKNYGAFFIILKKPNWKYKISWCVGTSPSSARGSLLGLRWVANSAEKYSTSVHLINFCVLLSIFHSCSETVEGGLNILKTLSIVKTRISFSWWPLFAVCSVIAVS